MYLFLDEIQELAGWETLINSLLVDMDADIYITGSNAHMFSGELATHLAGRYVGLAGKLPSRDFCGPGRNYSSPASHTEIQVQGFPRYFAPIPWTWTTANHSSGMTP